MNKDESQEELVRKWQSKVERAEKKYETYYDLIDETRAFYKSSKENTKISVKNALNIFWSCIETQKPFLYFLQPKPCIARSNKTSNNIESVACKILEKAIEWDLSQFDFDSVIKYARNDYLISGCGILWEQYKPTFKSLLDENSGQPVEIKESEVVVSEYLDPKDLLIDADKVGVFEEATWIAKRTRMTKEEAVKNFGDEVRDFIVDKEEPADKEKIKDVCIYEIWDKERKSPLTFLIKIHNKRPSF